jgi:glutaredoxin
MVKIYTQPGGSACHQATEYLSSKGVQFEEINIRQTPSAIRDLHRLGVMATPALMIGDHLIVGFAREEIDKAIAAVAKN